MVEVLRLRGAEYLLLDERHHRRGRQALAVAEAQPGTVAPAVGRYVQHSGGVEGVPGSLQRLGGTRLELFQHGVDRHVLGHFRGRFGC